MVALSTTWKKMLEDSLNNAVLVQISNSCSQRAVRWNAWKRSGNLDTGVASAALLVGQTELLLDHWIAIRYPFKLLQLHFLSEWLLSLNTGHRPSPSRHRRNRWTHCGPTA